eukprot:gnl/TRDRNA2_/TRDRNA2_150489_c0_seq2.p1 gnl/TRDRNA2_/TRDRNA2_150489_c0~~gnl/TRDRNA2_/TRDRNA2_150489_c0_seq2.p1  ORF type:complete len:335 (+),score=35.13 gnl/TRDRNA2_/TRDRNA2_150489_c0_seq2:61-1065(+)
MDGPQKKRLRVAGPEEVASDFRRLIDNAELGDVQFVLDEGPPIHGNKALLASRCAHFHHLFFGSGSAMQEGSGSSVNIKDCPREAFLGFLHLLYTGSTETVDAVALVEIHRLLDRYNMPQTADQLQKAILDNLTDETILDAAEAAQRGGQLALRDEIVKKVGSHLHSAVCSAADTLSRELLVSLLRNGFGGRPWDLATKWVLAKNTEVSDLHVRINGRKPGWHGAVLDVPNPQGFSVQGVAVGQQVSLWVCRFQPEGDYHFTDMITSWTSHRHSEKDAHLRLIFESQPTPMARLAVNEVEVRRESFIPHNDGYRPVILYGDRDGLRDICINDIT